MKYKTTKIIEDNELLKGWSLSKLSKRLGFNIAYISRVRSGTHVLSEEKYNEWKSKLGA